MQAIMLTSSKKHLLTKSTSRKPKDSEVVVRVHRAAIHPVDIETFSGKNHMMLPMKTPFTPGVDFTGVIEQVGAGVSAFATGDQIFGYLGLAKMGAYAQQIVVSAENIAPIPTHAPFEQCAAMPLPILCAMQAAHVHNLKRGDRVLVHGGAGGVGSVAVQVFSALGCQVYATASGEDISWVQSLGAIEVIDYKKVAFEDVVQDLDMVFDTVGGETLERSFAVVSKGRAVVSINAMPEAKTLTAAGLSLPLPVRMLVPLMRRKLVRLARNHGVVFDAQVTVPSGARLRQLVDLCPDVRARTAKVFEFTAFDEAMAFAVSGAPRGRVLLSWDG